MGDASDTAPSVLSTRGMGGVLDRIDAPLLGLPTMYYLMLGYLFFQTA